MIHTSGGVYLLQYRDPAVGVQNSTHTFYTRFQFLSPCGTCQKKARGISGEAPELILNEKHCGVHHFGPREVVGPHIVGIILVSGSHKVINVSAHTHAHSPNYPGHWLSARTHTTCLFLFPAADTEAPGCAPKIY